MSGNTPSSGSGLWTVISGTASISNAASPTSAVTGIPAGTSATLRWTVTDGPCLVFDEVILTNNAAPAITSASALTICSGSAVGLTITSDVPSNFVWYANSSSTVNGESTTNQSTSSISDVLTNVSTSSLSDQSVTYTITPTALSGGCPGATQTVTITVRRPLMVAISGSQVACGAAVNELLTASATAGVTGYQWYLNGTAISGATSATYTATSNGTYSVVIANSGGCILTSDNYNVTLPSALSISVSGTNISCSGADDGQASATITGGVNTKLIHFDNATNWVAGGAALSSYSNHTYNESDWVINAVSEGLRESMAPLNESPSVLGTYAWRLNSTPSTNQLMFTYNGTKEITGFGFKVRAYSLMPNWGVEYSTNGGSTWTLLTPSINATFLNSSNDWASFSHSFASPINVSTGQLKIRIIRQANSERIIVDDFYYSTTPEISWNTAETSSVITGLTEGTYTATVTNINGCSASNSVTIAAPTIIVITETTTNVLCNGSSTGIISTVVSGGVGPYTYSWSTGSTATSISGLSAGTYSLTVTDATGCSLTETYTISEPSVISTSANATTTALSCFGDQTTLSVTASGGTSPYTYSLNGGAFQSSGSFTVGAGSYTVTVRDANNCEVNSNNVLITQPAALTASISAGSIACFGGTTALTVTVSGGTTAYEYSLNGGAYQSSNTFTVGAGTYTVSVRDANLCLVATNTLTISEPTEIPSPTAGANTPLCEGETLNLTATSVSGATYSWTGPNGFTSALQNPSITGTTTANSGNYQVIATVSGCSSAPATIAVVVNPTPVITTQPVDAQVNQAASTTISVIASGVGATYQWQFATSASGPWSNVAAGTPTDVSYAGETTNTLTINAGESSVIGNGYYYRCIVSIGTCSVNSDAAQLTILIGNNTCAQAFEIQTDGVATSGTMTGATPYLCPDNNVWYYFTPTCTNTYTITLSNLSDDIDLYVYTGNCPTSCGGQTYSSVNGGTNNEIITANLIANTTYYIEIVDFATTGGTFNLAVSGPTLPVILLNATEQTVPDGGAVAFNTNGNNYASIQWQVSTNGGSTWANIINSSPYSGVTSTNLSISPVSNSLNQNQYRAEYRNITTGCNSVFSKAVKLNVWDALASADQVICDASTATISSSATGTIGNILFQENFESVSNYDGTGLGIGLGGWNLGISPPGNTTFNQRGNRWSVSAYGTGSYSSLSGLKSLAIMSRRGNASQDWYDGYNTGRSANIQAITPSVSSQSYSNIVLSFNWKSAGEIAGSTLYDYGQVGYSTDGSTVTWITTGGFNNTGVYHSTSTLTNQVINLPSILNNTTFYIHFRWINDGSAGTQPPFYIDDIVITGTPTITYAWTGPAGATYTPNNSSASTTVNTAGTYTGTISSVGGSASDDVVITMLPPVATGTLNSTAETICTGGDPVSISFTTLPSGGANVFNYQWYYKDGNNSCPTGSNTTGWTLISGATSPTYDPPAGLTVTRTYAVIVDVVGTPDCAAAQWAGCRVVTVVPDPFITGQPQSTQTLCVGGTPTNLQAIASGGTPSLQYQWYSNTTNSYSGAILIAGATSATYTPPTATAGTVYYFCTVTAAGNGCNPINSSIAAVIVVPDPSISAQPLATQTVCTGGALTALSLTAAGGTPSLTYQWYSSSTNSYAGSPIVGATSASYTPTSASAVTTYYYCIVSAAGNGCGSVNSQIAEVIVLSQPTISSQPLASQSVCINGVPTALSVSVTGGSSSFGYQWFSNTVSSNSGGTLISGATASSYTPASASAGISYYYCVITDNVTGCNDPVSNVAAVIVVNNILITSQPTNAPPVCQGGVGTFTVTATGGVAPISYQWQYFNGSSWNNVTNGAPTGAIYTGATSTSLSVSGITSSGSYDYRVVITSPGVGCVSATSNAAVLTIEDPISVTLNPVSNTTICAQGSVTYTVSGTGGTPSLNYTWQYKNPSTGGWVLPTTNPPAGAIFSGQGTTSFTISGITASGTWEYRCLLSASGNGCSNVTSTTAFLTVVPDPTITSQPQASSNICLNGSLTLSTIAANGTPSFVARCPSRAAVRLGLVSYAETNAPRRVSAAAGAAKPVDASSAIIMKLRPLKTRTPACGQSPGWQLFHCRQMTSMRLFLYAHNLWLIGSPRLQSHQ